MHLLSAAVALPLLAIAGPLGTRQATTCYEGVYIIVAPPHGAAGPGLQQTLVNNVTAAIPNSYAYSVPYDSSTADYPTALAQGEDLMIQEIENYAGNCPSSPIVLMGYSEGGIVVMNTLCGSTQTGVQLSTQYVSNILASIAYGEETNVPGQPYDAGTCTIGPSEHPRQNLAGCDPFIDSIKSYCDAGDGPCCSGTDPNGHFDYPANYDVIATQFVVDKYNSR